MKTIDNIVLWKRLRKGMLCSCYGPYAKAENLVCTSCYETGIVGGFKRVVEIVEKYHG
jgi:hypothetical protein